ncbi:MAG: phosphoglycerate dehydrogenase [Synergistaceae bacterium]|jgi:D-3-phosphoglycerate dehydrogenase|nr:phosphoglycerate dehydrogenase [Synergistaceae bacterium]
MFDILILNRISERIFEELPPSGFTVTDNSKDPDGILVRSATMLDRPFSARLLAVARAGAGYNNIPVSRCSEAGIVVFNTPGANANAVSELTLAGLLLSSRRIVEGVNWIRKLKAKGVSGLAVRVEKDKADFAGPELAGKKLGVIGLGAVGVLVANACEALGMAVAGYDPYLSVDAAWGLSRRVSRATSLSGLLAESDYITLHVPLTDATRCWFGETMLNQVKRGARLLNFSRGEIVDDPAALASLRDGRLARYVTDFPSDELVGAEGVIVLPHLGASTPEAEDNCAVMAARQLRNYLESGVVANSVNLPDCDIGPAWGARLTVINRNVPNVVGPITTALAGLGMNIANMLNKSKGDYAYNIIDLDDPGSAGVPASEALASAVEKIAGINGVIRVRVIDGKSDGRRA